MKKLIGFVVLLVLAGGGWWYYIKYGKPPEKPTVNFATISRGNIIEAVTSTGTLDLRQFDLTFANPGGPLLVEVWIDAESRLARVTIPAGGYSFEVDGNVVDVFVSYLRRKLEAAGEPRILHTVRGVGFVLRP